MKNLLTLSLVAAFFLTACTKSNVNKNTTTQGVLLSKTIDNTPESPTYGLTTSQAIYNGRQLVKAIGYATPTVFETDVFSYNSAGQLTGTTLSTSNNGVITAVGLNGESTSKITYTGDNITEIKYYDQNNVMDDDEIFTWQNGYVTKIVETSTNASTKFTYSGSTIFQYDGNNHNTKIMYTFTENDNGRVNAGGDTSINNTFDNKTNVTSTLPFAYTYFFNAHSSNDFSSANYGANNVLTVSVAGGFSETDSFLYNSFGLPSSETAATYQLINNVNTKIGSDTIGYEYIQAN